MGFEPRLHLAAQGLGLGLGLGALLVARRAPGRLVDGRARVRARGRARGWPRGTLRARVGASVEVWVGVGAWPPAAAPPTPSR